jgi:hypothetical protein
LIGIVELSSNISSVINIYPVIRRLGCQVLLLVLNSTHHHIDLKNVTLLL